MSIVSRCWRDKNHHPSSHLLEKLERLMKKLKMNINRTWRYWTAITDMLLLCILQLNIFKNWLNIIVCSSLHTYKLKCFFFVMITVYSSEISRKAYNVGIEITLGIEQYRERSMATHSILLWFHGSATVGKHIDPNNYFVGLKWWPLLQYLHILLFDLFPLIIAHRWPRATKILPLLLKSVNS